MAFSLGLSCTVDYRAFVKVHTQAYIAPQCFIALLKNSLFYPRSQALSCFHFSAALLVIG